MLVGISHLKTTFFQVKHTHHIEKEREWEIKKKCAVMRIGPIESESTDLSKNSHIHVSMYVYKLVNNCDYV